MLNSIIGQVCSELRAFGAEPVYSSFDAVPVTKKESGIYTIVGIESFSTTASVYSQYIVYIPFSAGISIKVTAPPDCSLEKLYSYYSSKVAPAVSELTGLSCRLKNLSVKFDSNLCRLVLTVLLDAEGITRIERWTV